MNVVGVYDAPERYRRPAQPNTWNIRCGCLRYEFELFIHRIAKLIALDHQLAAHCSHVAEDTCRIRL